MYNSKYLNKKAMSSVIVLLLLLVLVTGSFVVLSNWNKGFLSSFSNELLGDTGNVNLKNVVSLESLENGVLYVRSKHTDNITYTDIKIKSESTLLSGLLEPKTFTLIDLSSFFSNREEGIYTISLFSDSGVVSGKFYYSGISTFRLLWNTTITGLNGADTIELPLQPDGIYNFVVDWGDGTTDTITSWNQAEVTHTYSSGGVYAVNITGIIDGWSFYATGDDETDCDKLLEVSEWGPLKLSNGGRQFYDCDNLNITATDAPDLSSVNDVSYMFAYSSGFDGNLNNWDVSSVTDMSYMFNGAVSFNQPYW